MENAIVELKQKFNELEPSLLEEISDVGTLRFVKSGESVMRTGQHLGSAMLILSGSIKVFREGEDGGDFFLYYIHTGQACAMSLTCLKHQETSQVSAVAVEDSTLLFVPMTKVNDWIREYRTWSEFVIHTYRTRFEEALAVIDNVAFRGMDERLEFYLKNGRRPGGCPRTAGAAAAWPVPAQGHAGAAVVAGGGPLRRPAGARRAAAALAEGRGGGAG